MDDRYDARYFNFFQLIFNQIFCPECDIKMKRIEWPYSMGWQCPNCGWITWYKHRIEISKGEN